MLSGELTNHRGESGEMMSGEITADKCAEEEAFIHSNVVKRHGEYLPTVLYLTTRGKWGSAPPDGAVVQEDHYI